MAPAKKAPQPVGPDPDSPPGPSDKVLGPPVDGTQEAPTVVDDDQAATQGGPAPSWAADDQAPEVMTSREMRAAGQDPTGAVTAPREAPTALTVTGPATAWLANSLVEEARLHVDSDAAVMEDITAQIMNATTLDEILADSGLVESEEILGVPIQIWDFKVNESDYAQGLPFYLVIKCIRQDTMSDILVSCGSWKVVGQLLAMKQRGMLPAIVKLHRREKATRNGYHPMALIAP